MSLKEKLDPGKIPQHVAIIMDGNGRWAKGKGKFRIFGHQNGVSTVKTITEAAAEMGIKYLTLYAFSTENWSRPALEVRALMELLVDTMRKELPTLMKNKIRLSFIGNMNDLPEKCQKQIKVTMEETKDNNRMDLVLALSYSAKWDLVQAVKNISQDVHVGKINQDQINDKLIDSYLSTNWMPHPELLIRTSGEKRISNFLLWEIAYSELYFTEKLWPDFTKEDLYHAVYDFQNRERRFGKTSEQLSS
ncbi:MAG: isoprenyl transferase [Bacteroidia bacterium]|nr:isoprenyl transferase [Bacteroidia bacterium]MCF8426788.1 isoprenyl transferase [Bacteroidia bacterium]MCF8445580.1 isoprenyl transferase [Bacteroidia bacterium]